MSQINEKHKKAALKKCNYRAWFRFLYTFFYPFLKLMFPGRALGMENLPKGKGYIMTLNHRSGKEGPMLYLVIPRYWHYLAKDENYKSAGARWLFPRIGVVSVNRDKPELSTIRQISGYLKKNEPLAVFPEGTRNKDDSGEMLEHKSGAALFALQNKVPVIPIYIYRKPRFFRKNYLLIGKPIDPEKYSGGRVDVEKIQAFATEIRAAMEDVKQQLETIMAEGRYNQELAAERKRVKKARQEQKREKAAQKKAAKAAAKSEDKN